MSEIDAGTSGGFVRRLLWTFLLRFEWAGTERILELRQRSLG